MSKGLTLTLNDLIKLGVIKLKKRKNKNKKKQLRLQSHKVPYNSVESTRASSDHMRGYATVNNLPPVMNPYTDNLRLRDANDNFNTKLLEYKNQLHDEKFKTDDFIGKSKLAYSYLLHNLSNTDRFGDENSQLPVERRLGYALDDSIDIADSSTGFESQISQTQGGTSPYLMEGTPEYLSLQTPSQVIQEDDDPSETIQIPRKETIVSTPEGPKARRTLGRFVKSLTGGSSKKPVSFTVDETDVKVGGGAGAHSTPPRTVEITSKKPSKVELESWRKWYEDLGGKDDSITASPHRPVYKQAISKLLLEQYVQAGGNDSNILKSKEPNVINIEIRKLLKKQFK